MLLSGAAGESMPRRFFQLFLQMIIGQEVKICLLRAYLQSAE